jgi:hypothetical protein
VGRPGAFLLGFLLVSSPRFAAAQEKTGLPEVTYLPSSHQLAGRPPYDTPFVIVAKFPMNDTKEFGASVVEADERCPTRAQFSALPNPESLKDPNLREFRVVAGLDEDGKIVGLRLRKAYRLCFYYQADLTPARARALSADALKRISAMITEFSKTSTKNVEAAAAKLTGQLHAEAKRLISALDVDETHLQPLKTHLTALALARLRLHETTRTLRSLRDAATIGGGDSSIAGLASKPPAGPDGSRFMQALFAMNPMSGAEISRILIGEWDLPAPPSESISFTPRKRGTDVLFLPGVLEELSRSNVSTANEIRGALAGFGPPLKALGRQEKAVDDAKLAVSKRLVEMYSSKDPTPRITLFEPNLKPKDRADRIKSYVTADIGLALTGFGGEGAHVVPTVALNLYFRPIDSTLGRWSDHYDGLDFFSIVLGVTTSLPEVDGTTLKGLVSDNVTPLVGLGWMPFHFSRVSAGFVLAKAEVASEISKATKPAPGWFVRLSLDVDVAKLLSDAKKALIN